jgi:hypothetical protein
MRQGVHLPQDSLATAALGVAEGGVEEADVLLEDEEALAPDMNALIGLPGVELAEVGEVGRVLDLEELLRGGCR